MKKSFIVSMLLATLSMPSFATEVDIKTTLGTIRVDLNEEAAPKTVDNFLSYVDEGFYNDVIFHRVIQGFMIQGGGFKADLDRKQTHHAIAYEGNNGLYNDRGTIAMARTQDPNSATSQFFINQVDNAFLNHGARGSAGYTVFGKVTAGMDVVDKIGATPTRNVGPYQNVPVTPVIIESISRVN
ncbi:peptidylprolyl isomerase A [Marinomonas piezotolerans]|uniref:Peptidyl-prolyl cis-trans isomerase n=1 Tax=Marinomonas piezotolerans TaxID=2213058 RepID=A0A370U760_9GAMM|nr:peptidylprolyl isomerase [Marinomonas piezotolerans]RDL43616.1 peptidylprolyl isomerase A [Marinomonas piezotolerans]